MDGIFNIYKASGLTSHDVVARIRKLLKQRRVGHAGTLDPAASGVLPICVGLGTRVAEYLSESGKAYRATLAFGSETDTYDAEGQVIRTAPAEHLDQVRIEEVLKQFTGPQMQVPPRYSAIKVQGQAAYKRTRAGEELTLPARPIELYSLDIQDWQPPLLTLDIACSKGTYIRSLAYDLGRALDSAAHLSNLVRTRSGPFHLSESVTLEELALAQEKDQIERYLYPPDYALADYPALYLDAEKAERVKHGIPFTIENRTNEHPSSLARAYHPQGTFLAIAEWREETGMWHPKKVFPTHDDVSEEEKESPLA